MVSATSKELIDPRELIPSGSEHDEEQRQLKRRLIKSIRNDHEQCWVAKAEDMKKAAAIVIIRQLFRFIEETCNRNPAVSKTISEKDGVIVHS